MLHRIIEMINRYETFLITSHVRPDGDAIGSELALYHILKEMGKEALVYNQDGTPGNYQFLPGSETIVHDLQDPERYDVLFVLDCGDLERIGAPASRIGGMKRIINIDHHVSNAFSHEITYVDDEASSTGELLYRLIVQMGICPTSDAANNLYTAIMTDTGGFRYRSTKKETLFAAGCLVGYGADPQWLSENIYENTPQEKVQLLRDTLETLTFDLDGKAASLVVYLDVIAKAGALSEHIEGFVDIPRAIKGVEVSILYLELSKDSYKLSLRSKNKINVEQVARQFGGGGHLNAAACQMTGKLETIKKQVTDALRVII